MKHLLTALVASLFMAVATSAQSIPGLKFSAKSLKPVGDTIEAKENVKIEYGGTFVKADSATLNNVTKTLDIRGNVELTPAGSTEVMKFPGLSWNLATPPGTIQPYTTAPATTAAPAPAKPAPTPAPTPATAAPVKATPKPAPKGTVTPTPKPPAAKPAPKVTATPAKPATPSVTTPPVKAAPSVAAKTPVVPKPAPVKPTARPVPTAPEFAFVPGLKISAKKKSLGGNIQTAEGDVRIEYMGTVITAPRADMDRAKKIIDASGGVTILPKGSTKSLSYKRVIWNLSKPPGVMQPYYDTAAKTTPTTVKPAATPAKPATPTPSVTSKPVAPKPPAKTTPAPAVTAKPLPKPTPKPTPAPAPKPAVVTPPVVAAPAVKASASTPVSFMDGVEVEATNVTPIGKTQVATGVTIDYAGMKITAAKAVIDAAAKTIDASGGVTLLQPGSEIMKFDGLKMDLSTPPGVITPILNQ